MITESWKRIIDEQLPSLAYDVDLAEEIAQSAGCNVRQIEKYLEEREANDK